jgi:hypothetical protein
MRNRCLERHSSQSHERTIGMSVSTQVLRRVLGSVNAWDQFRVTRPMANSRPLLVDASKTLDHDHHAFSIEDLLDCPAAIFQFSLFLISVGSTAKLEFLIEALGFRERLEDSSASAIQR